LRLDVFQHQAFVTALISDFCVIQGPPGTGKTYIGLKIVEVLLQNMKLNENCIRQPILVVCFTNHALDQFLVEILQFTKKIIRVGSQSKSELLKDYNLRGRNQYEIRRSNMARNQMAPAMMNIRVEVQKNLSAINCLTEQKNRLEKPVGIVRYDTLRSLMTEEQRNVLRSADCLLRWLLECEDEEPSTSTLSKKEADYASDERSADDEAEEGPSVEESETEDDDHLVDEDDIFEMNSTTKQPLSTDSPYQLTIEELEGECATLLQTLLWLRDLPDEEIPDLAEHYNSLHVTEMELNSLNRRLRILRKQLTNANLPVGEKTKRILAKNVCHLSVPERWVVYWSWIKVLRDNVIKELQEIEEQYRNSLAQYADFKQMEDLFVVQQAEIVGMTTTQAARLHRLLNALEPAIGKSEYCFVRQWYSTFRCVF
jgi:hypothetical protein